MSLNLDEIINRAISIAQASGQAKRDNALEVAKMNADTYKAQGDRQLEIANLAAGTDRYKADSSAKIAETKLRGDMYRGDSQVQAANIGLVGNTVRAGAEAYSSDLRAAQPIVGGIVKAQSEMQQYPANATDMQKSIIDRDNLSRSEFVKTAANDPQYLRASGARFDPVAAAQNAASGLGVQLGGLRSEGYFTNGGSQPTPGVGAQTQPNLRVEQGRTPQAQSLRFPTPKVDVPTLPAPGAPSENMKLLTGQSANPLTKDRRPKLMDPTRIGTY